MKPQNLAFLAMPGVMDVMKSQLEEFESKSKSNLPKVKLGFNPEEHIVEIKEGDCSSYLVASKTDEEGVYLAYTRDGNSYFRETLEEMLEHVYEFYYYKQKSSALKKSREIFVRIYKKMQSDYMNETMKNLGV